MKYLLTIVDVFSYFVLVEPLPNKEAETTLDAVLRAFNRTTKPICFYYNPSNKFAII